MTRNPRDARAGRTRPTTLELRVLRAAARGDWVSAIAPGHTSRVYSQAYARLKRMGLIGAATEAVTPSGSAALAEARREGRLRD